MWALLHPRRGGESKKLIIFNHALPVCRAGFQGHFGAPWSNFDPVELDFVIQILTDAGYNVLTYDMRNHRSSPRFRAPQDGCVHSCRDDAPAIRRRRDDAVFMIQVLQDAWTRNPEDAQKTFELLASKDKELFWIENTTRRFDGSGPALRMLSLSRGVELRNQHEPKPARTGVERHFACNAALAHSTRP